jgi:hypothetical protein
MTSVGTGSLVYASAGLLAHRPATTHWASLDLLAELDATIDVRRDEWFVDDGDVVASAGISAGHRRGAAPRRPPGRSRPCRETRRGIQYGPAPPVWPRAIKRDTHADRQRDFSDVPTALGVPYAYWGLTASTTTSTARPSRPRHSSQDIPVNYSAAFAPVLQTHARHRNRHHRSGTGIGHSDQPHTARRHVTVVDGQIQRASVTTMKDVAG